VGRSGEEGSVDSEAGVDRICVRPPFLASRGKTVLLEWTVGMLSLYEFLGCALRLVVVLVAWRHIALSSRSIESFA